MRWTTLGTLHLRVTRGGRCLSINMTPSDDGNLWAIVCIETRKEYTGEGIEMAREILADHAHEVLEARSLPEAIALGEKYAKWWQGSRVSHFSCECDDIDKT